MDPPLCDVYEVPHNGWAAVRLKISHAGEKSNVSFFGFEFSFLKVLGCFIVTFRRITWLVSKEKTKNF